MVKAGSIVTVYDPDLQDMYVAEVMADNPDEQHLNTLVKILWIVRYPIQHAILCPEVANENPPIMGGTICRLRFYHYTSPVLIPFAESLRDARQDAITDAQNRGRTDILAILYRHRQGDYGRKRSVMTA